MKGLFVADSQARQKRAGGLDILRIIGEQEEFPGRTVFGQDLSAPVIDPAPQPGKRKPAKTVVLGEISPTGPVHELEVGQAEMEKAEDCENQ